MVHPVFKLTLLCETILFLECATKKVIQTWMKLEICWKLLKCMKNFTHIALCKMYLNIRFWHTIPSFMQDLHTISCCVNFWRLKMRHFSPTQEIEPIISHRVFKFKVLGFSAIILTGFLNLRLWGFKERAHISFLNNPLVVFCLLFVST